MPATAPDLELTGQGHFPVARHRGAHLGERPAGKVFDLGDLSRSSLRVDRSESTSEACLHRDRGQGVPEQVAEVTGNSGALDALTWWRGFCRFASRPVLRECEGAGRWAVHTQPHGCCTTQCRRTIARAPTNAVAVLVHAWTFGFLTRRSAPRSGAAVARSTAPSPSTRETAEAPSDPGSTRAHALWVPLSRCR